jgi:RNA polymerase sigma factor (TIGR02999 family)
MANNAVDVTALLQQAAGGRTESLDRLIPIVYEELRRVAHAVLRGERPDHTLNTTALVHETYLKLVDLERVEWRDRAHFFAAAAGAMRRILIDHARTRNREKRGGGAVQVTLDEGVQAAIEVDEGLVALDDALTRLELVNPRHARLVENRFFAGLTMEETAEVLRVSLGTVKRDWSFCRAWLNRELSNVTSTRQSPPATT